MMSAAPRATGVVVVDRTVGLKIRVRDYPNIGVTTRDPEPLISVFTLSVYASTCKLKQDYYCST